MAALSRARQGHLSRAKVATACGYSASSGTVNRALYGVLPNSSSGKPRPGLFFRKYVTAEGTHQGDLEILPAGQAALDAYVAAHGPLPAAKDQRSKTNKRYLAGWRVSP